MRIVLDTNVVVSAALILTSPPALVVRAWREGRVEVLSSPTTLDELRGVFARPQIARRLLMSPEEQRAFVEEFVRSTTLVVPDLTVTAITADPSDNMFLELAVAGRADYIVSGDAHLTSLDSYEGIPILTPARFLSVLALEQPPASHD